ncbi:UDP-N-acetylmuramoyl-tripeptide--D-alanyl-D-alanine ligase [Candidatus Azambacteria bacterium]|nr:UDP-N-acetylmuramoyl-tripeptide--D-alanyl-D-alanine ligase [Candidatus Azambacteria bacterium]
MRKILQKILKIAAKLMLLRYKPKIIAVTGSVGKTSAKDAIYAVLENDFNVRKSEKSFNNEIGVPLTILGIGSAGKNVFLWIWNLLKVISYFIWTKYPKILVLEFGVDKPGDMDYLLEIAKPDIAVVTAIGDIPAHIEKFSGSAEVVKEKSKLVKAVSKDGIVILNCDYDSVASMEHRTRARVLTYGFLSEAKLKIHKSDTGIQESGIFLSSSFKVEYEGSVVPVRLNAFGVPSIYAAVAACAVGIALDMNLVEISQALLKNKTPKSRMNILEGIHHSVILDDSYNASPESMKEALNSLKNIKAKRKVAVFGSMLEIGRYSEDSHRDVGKVASAFCDLIITVGDKAIFIADEALKNGFKKGENLFVFENSDELAKKIKNFIKEDDLILFKGSRGVKLETAIKEVLT